jgi:hypothetical protein
MSGAGGTVLRCGNPETVPLVVVVVVVIEEAAADDNDNDNDNDNDSDNDSDDDNGPITVSGFAYCCTSSFGPC